MDLLRPQSGPGGQYRAHFHRGPGEAIITASWKNQTAECLVQVEAAGTEENTDLEAQPESLPEAEARLPQYEPRVKE